MFSHMYFYCYLKGHGNEADLLGFLQKLVPHRSLTLPFDFGFEFAEIFIFEKRLPDSTSRQLSDSLSQGVGNSLTWQVGESAFECLKENSASWRVSDSPTSPDSASR